MSLADAFAPVEEANRNAVLYETWGHLDAKPGVVYNGFILFTLGAYGDITIIKSEFENLDDSPWFYADMTNFVCDKAKENGKVYAFQGTYKVSKSGKGKFTGKVNILNLNILLGRGFNY